MPQYKATSDHAVVSGHPNFVLVDADALGLGPLSPLFGRRLLDFAAVESDALSAIDHIVVALPP